jgi:hypothetical protein
MIHSEKSQRHLAFNLSYLESMSCKSSIPGNGVAGSTSSSILTSPKFFAEIRSFLLNLDDPPPIEDALPILGEGELK